MRASLLKYQYVNELNPDNKHFIVELDSLLYSKQLKGDVYHGLTEWQELPKCCLAARQSSPISAPCPCCPVTQISDNGAAQGGGTGAVPSTGALLQPQHPLSQRAWRRSWREATCQLTQCALSSADLTQLFE